MRACQCGTTLMSLVTSCTLASLLLSSAKECVVQYKKKTHWTKHSDKCFFFFNFFFASIVHTSVRFQKKNQSQELWQASEKRCVFMLHVKHSENKVPDKWDLKHKRYFHAQLLHITDIMRCRSPPRPTSFAKKKIQLPCGRARQIIKLEASMSQCSDSAKPTASTTIDTCKSHIVTMSSKVLAKNKHEPKLLWLAEASRHQDRACVFARARVCVCACLCVCVCVCVCACARALL